MANEATGARVKRTLNHALRRATGYQLTRPPDPPKPHKRVDRLVKRPIFILAPVRSGSTLFRVILDSHSQICAPHELHLRTVHVRVSEYGQRAMKEIELDARSLEHLLWDRILHRELTASGKRLIVEKTPNTAFGWERLPEAWPKARYIFLLRHPAAIAVALNRVWEEGPGKDADMPAVIERVREYTNQVDQARQHLPGLTVKYEELVAEPERVMAGVCDFLRVPWEPSMLDYGDYKHGRYAPRLGDWGRKIRSGRIDSEIVLPADDEIPPELLDVSRSWGYLT